MLLTALQEFPTESLRFKQLADERAATITRSASVKRIQAMADLEFFKGSAPGFLQLLERQVEERAYMAGQELMVEGEEGSTLYVLLSGEVSVLVGGVPVNKPKDEAAIDIGSKNWPEFRILLINKFGNLLRAWKFALDDDGNGRLSFYEFCNAVRKLGYIGNYNELWETLGGPSDKHGFIFPEGLDPEMARMINEFRDKLIARAGNYVFLTSFNIF